MSLQDESFPSDELFDMLNGTAAANNRRLPYQFSVCVNDESSMPERQTSPFSNGDCLEKDVSNKDVRQNDHHSHKNPQLGSARSSKALSYQDIHSAYTKRRYKHVDSKVRKYINDIHDQEQRRRNSSSIFQRHRSMPECLTPRSNNEEHHKLNKTLSITNSSTTDTNERDDSYERLNKEKERLQSYNDYLESQLYKKIDDHMVLKNNFESVRIELSDCMDKLNRPIGGTINGGLYHSHLIVESVAKATQTDQPQNAAHMLQLSDLSDIPTIAANVMPHPNRFLNDISYDSSIGSIEIPLLSVPHAVRQQNPNKPIKNSSTIKPLSLNFSNDSVEVDANAGNDLKPNSSNRIVTNNSGSSQPSSNDSAIEIEVHGLRSPQPGFRGQTINLGTVRNWNHRDGIIYFDKQNNQVIQLVPLNPSANSNVHSSNSMQGQSFNVFQYTANSRGGMRKKSLTSRVLRIFGSCARCDDPNHTLDTTSDTYTVGIPLLSDDSNPSQNMR